MEKDNTNQPSLNTHDESAAICVNILTFSYDPKSLEPTLKNLNLKLPKGSRCLLIGANGDCYFDRVG